MDKTLNQVKEFCELFGHKTDKSVPDNKTVVLRLGLILEELCELADAQKNEVTLEFIEMLKVKASALKNRVDAKIYNNINATSLHESMDALVDLRYVLDGTTLAFGLADKFDEVFDIVHENNMTKATRNEQIAINSVEHYRAGGVYCDYGTKIVNGETYFVIFATKGNVAIPAGKILKPIGYTPVEFHL